MTKNKFTIKINKMKRNMSLGIISSDLRKKRIYLNKIIEYIIEMIVVINVVKVSKTIKE